MQCGRCHGLMITESFTDLLDDTGKLRFAGWRCVACGEIVDPVIVSNRLRGDSVSRRPQRHRRLFTLVSQTT